MRQLKSNAPEGQPASGEYSSQQIQGTGSAKGNDARSVPQVNQQAPQTQYDPTTA